MAGVLKAVWGEIETLFPHDNLYNPTNFSSDISWDYIFPVKYSFPHFTRLLCSVLFCWKFIRFVLFWNASWEVIFPTEKCSFSYTFETLLLIFLQVLNRSNTADFCWLSKDFWWFSKSLTNQEQKTTHPIHCNVSLHWFLTLIQFFL